MLVEQICEEIKAEKLDLLNSHTLLKALAKTYIRETQFRLIIQPILNQLIEHFGSQTKLETRLTQILGQLREKPGYGGGNILNLLCQLNTDLRGYDFSYLTIRQAYLQGMNLAEVNFAHSLFAQTVFTQSFGGIHSIAFSPDGKLLAMGDSQGEIRLIRVGDEQQILQLQRHRTTMWVPSIAFSRNGQYLVMLLFCV